MSNGNTDFTLTFLGTGTSCGLPAPHCQCNSCKSQDPKDTRFRTSAILSGPGGTRILFDCGPDFREQALRCHVPRVDIVLQTHSHADHSHGYFDLLPYTQEHPIDVYGNKDSLDEIRMRFNDLFKEETLSSRIVLHLIDGPIAKCGLRIIPLPVKHGRLDIYGFRIGNFAYITDASFVSEETLSLMRGIKYLVVNTLFQKYHPTHFNFDDTLAFAKRTDAKEIWCVHISHPHTHAEIVEYFNEKTKDDPEYAGRSIGIAVDGMELHGIDLLDYTGYPEGF